MGDMFSSKKKAAPQKEQDVDEQKREANDTDSLGAQANAASVQPVSIPIVPCFGEGGEHEGESSDGRIAPKPQMMNAVTQRLANASGDSECEEMRLEQTLAKESMNKKNSMFKDSESEEEEESSNEVVAEEPRQNSTNEITMFKQDDMVEVPLMDDGKLTGKWQRMRICEVFSQPKKLGDPGIYGVKIFYEDGSHGMDELIIDPKYLRLISKDTVSNSESKKEEKSVEDTPENRKSEDDASNKMPSLGRRDLPVSGRKATGCGPAQRRLADGEITMVQSAGIGSAITLTVGFLAYMVYRRFAAPRKPEESSMQMEYP